jgi:hypothetical protein
MYTITTRKSLPQLCVLQLIWSALVLWHVREGLYFACWHVFTPMTNCLILNLSSVQTLLHTVLVLSIVYFLLYLCYTVPSSYMLVVLLVLYSVLACNWLSVVKHINKWIELKWIIIVTLTKTSQSIYILKPVSSQIMSITTPTSLQHFRQATGLTSA